MELVEKNERVTRLEKEILCLPQVEIRTFHSFPDGLYERLIVVPPHTIITGAEHKTSYKVRLEKGSLAVTVQDGVQVFHAPAEFTLPAGVKNAGLSFDEMVQWVDVYENPDNCRNIEELENRYYVVPKYGMADGRNQDQKLMIENMKTSILSE